MQKKQPNPDAHDIGNGCTKGTRILIDYKLRKKQMEWEMWKSSLRKILWVPHHP